MRNGELFASKMNHFSRRDFLKSVSLTAVTAAIAPLQSRAETTRANIKLGLDNFSVRAMGWKAPALIDYAVALKTDSLFITDLDAFETFDEGYLHGLKSKAADSG